MLNSEQELALNLNAHIAVAAGAGSGKTRVLVERYLRIIAAGESRVRGILALTFTEKAAAEMKLRVRREMNGHIAKRDSDRSAGFWEAALEDFREPNIFTFHAMCAALLREFPMEAGIDPAFGVMDETESSALLQETIEAFLRQRAASGDGRVARLAGLWGRKRMAEVLAAMMGRRAVSGEWAAEYAAMTPAQAAARGREAAVRWADIIVDKQRLSEILAELRQLGPADDGDVLAPHYYSAVRALGAMISGAPADLADLTGINLKGGKKANWADLPCVKLLLTECRDAGKQLAEFTFTTKDEYAAEICTALAPLFNELREEYDVARGGGLSLDFDGLEEKTLQLLESRPDVRDILRKRYTHILVDEFQDTNDLQWKIVRLIAVPPGSELPESNIFIVGDGKQSIYGFRGANVAVFERAAVELAEANGGGPLNVELSECYRSHPALIAFFNRIFKNIFKGAGRETFLPDIRYFELKPGRTDEDDGKPRVEFLLKEDESAEEDGDQAAMELTAAEAEAEMIAARIAGLAAEGLHYGDMAVLFRSRTHLQEYRDALRARGIPFVIAGGLGFFECREVRDLIAILGFLAHPCDDISLAGALHSPHIGLSDEDLLEVSASPGLRFRDKLAAAAACGESPGAERIHTADAMIRSWEAAAGRVSLSELLERICSDTGIFGAVGAGPRPEQSAMNIQKVFSLARSFERGSFCSVGRFVDYLNGMIERGAREAEAVIPGENLDAIKMMTVHAAKGLEFPAVIVAGMAAGRYYGMESAVCIEEFERGVYEIGFGVPDPESGFDTVPGALRKIGNHIRKRKEEEESRRLLYVACTRAKERLILSGMRASLFGGEGKADDSAGRWDEIVAAAMKGAAMAGVRMLTAADIAGMAEPAPAAKSAPEGLLEKYEKIYDAAAPAPPDERLRYYAPLVPGGGPPLRFSVTETLTFLEDRDAYRRQYILGVPPEWGRARARGPRGVEGAEDPLLRGRVVHRLYEEIADAPPGGGEAFLRKLLAEEGVASEESFSDFAARYLPGFEAFRASALGAAVSGSGARRELGFVLPVGRWELAGVMDAAFRDGDEWHVLDYKTDRIKQSQIVEKDEHYGPQIDMYAMALMAGVPGVEAVGVSVYYIEPGERGRVRTFGPAEAVALRALLEDAFAQMEKMRRGI